MYASVLLAAGAHVVHRPNVYALLTVHRGEVNATRESHVNYTGVALCNTMYLSMKQALSFAQCTQRQRETNEFRHEFKSNERFIKTKRFFDDIKETHSLHDHLNL